MTVTRAITEETENVPAANIWNMKREAEITGARRKSIWINNGSNMNQTVATTGYSQWETRITGTIRVECWLKLKWRGNDSCKKTIGYELTAENNKYIMAIYIKANK